MRFAERDVGNKRNIKITFFAPSFPIPQESITSLVSQGFVFIEKGAVRAIIPSVVIFGLLLMISDEILLLTAIESAIFFNSSEPREVWVRSSSLNDPDPLIIEESSTQQSFYFSKQNKTKQ